MRRIITSVTCLCLATFFLTSCVAKRRYLNAKMKEKEATEKNMALNSRITRLEDTIGSLHANISSLNGRIGALGNANENAANELNMTKEQIAAQRQRLHQLQSFIDMQQKATEDLKKKISDALVGFNSNELTVSMKDGRVYISMQESLLFPSGSAVVNPKGKDALSKVAAVLNTNSDINIDVEGHTDNQPIHTTKYPDNWALSTARATSIAHVLIDEYKVTPGKLIASGRSYYAPIADNSTAQGRAQNRRTEIILEPKLDELMQIMGTPVPTMGR